MPNLLPSYGEVTSALAPVLDGLPPRLVAVAGPVHAGKSTLSRYLAWHFNVTLVETDPFLTGGPPAQERYEYRSSEVRAILDFRLKTMRRPVLVEGVAVLQLLREIGLEPDFVVGVRTACQAAPAVPGHLKSITVTHGHPEG